MASHTMILLLLLLSGLLPAAEGTCFVSELLGVTACTGQSPPGSPSGGERVVRLDPPSREPHLSPGCSCTDERNPVCLISTGAPAGQNPSCALCAGHRAEDLITCTPQASAREIVAPPQRPEPCGCSTAGMPVCDIATGHALARNECRARCAGFDPTSFAVCGGSPTGSVKASVAPSMQEPSVPPACRCPKNLDPVCDATTRERLADNGCLAICAGMESSRLVRCRALPAINAPAPSAMNPSQPPAGQPASGCRCDRKLEPVCHAQTGEQIATNPCLARCNGVPAEIMVRCNRQAGQPALLDGTPVDSSQLPLQPRPQPQHGASCSDASTVGDFAGYAGCYEVLSACSALPGEDFELRGDASADLTIVPALCSADAITACEDSALEFVSTQSACLNLLTGNIPAGSSCEGGAVRALFREKVRGVCQAL